MTRFEAEILKNDLKYLNEALFVSAECNLAQEINAFVNAFEPGKESNDAGASGTNESDNAPIGPDQLAAMFVHLSNCNHALQKSKQEQTICEETLASVRNASNALQDVHAKVEAIKAEQATHPPPFSTERAQFLDDLNMRRREIESKLRREQDKLEEFYAKKTRESTFHNIVGLR